MFSNESSRNAWNQARTGTNCALCVPRSANDYRIQITTLSSSTLYLFRDQRFRGYCLLIFDPRHATGLDQLSDQEFMRFMQDVRRAAHAIHAAVQPDHMNYECLGNSSPHLHWHLVPRFHTDPRWGQPIWEGWQRNEFHSNPVTLPEHEYQELIERIRAAILAPNV